MRTLSALMLLAACGDDGTATGGPPLEFGAMGSLSSPAGKGGFRFGAASAATQIEDGNTETDWYLWTRPAPQGGLAKGTFVGDAVRGDTKVLDDVALVADLGLDSYRFSMEWARIEPVKDQINEEALAHYRGQLEAMRSLGVRPIITVHHFHPRFGLFRVDYSTYARTPNDGTDVFASIARTRSITSAQRARYGGTGPMTREPDHDLDSMCRKATR